MAHSSSPYPPPSYPPPASGSYSAHYMSPHPPQMYQGYAQHQHHYQQQGHHQHHASSPEHQHPQYHAHHQHHQYQHAAYQHHQHYQQQSSYVPPTRYDAAGTPPPGAHHPPYPQHPQQHQAHAAAGGPPQHPTSANMAHHHSSAAPLSAAAGTPAAPAAHHQIYVGYGSQTGLSEEDVFRYIARFGEDPHWVTHVPIKACFFAEVAVRVYELMLDESLYPKGAHQIGHARCVVRAANNTRTVAPAQRTVHIESNEFAHCRQIYVGYGQQGAIISPKMVVEYLSRFGVVRWVSHLAEKSCMFAEFTQEAMAQAAIRHSNVGQHVVGQALVNINPVKRAFVVNSTTPNVIAGPGMKQTPFGNIIEDRRTPAATHAPAANDGAASTVDRRRPRIEAKWIASALLEGFVGVEISRPALDDMLGAYGLTVTRADDPTDAGDIELDLEAADEASIRLFDGGSKTIPYAGADFTITVANICPVEADRALANAAAQPAAPVSSRAPEVFHARQLHIQLRAEQPVTAAAVDAALSAYGTVIRTNWLPHRHCLFAEMATEAEAAAVLAARLPNDGFMIGRERVTLRQSKSRLVPVNH